MAVDSLTKRMKADSLYPVMNGWLDLTPSTESVLIKLHKQKQRQEKTAAKANARELKEAKSYASQMGIMTSRPYVFTRSTRSSCFTRSRST